MRPWQSSGEGDGAGVRGVDGGVAGEAHGADGGAGEGVDGGGALLGDLEVGRTVAVAEVGDVAGRHGSLLSGDDCTAVPWRHGTWC